MKREGVPAVALAGALTTKVRGRRGVDGTIAAGAGDRLVTVSVAVIVWLPAVISVTLKVPAPLVSVALAGSTAAASLLVKWTVPRIAGGRVVERVLGRDRDVNVLPAVALAGALTVKCVRPPR